jgi:probable F420-dependent oxidoreductase
MGTTERRLGVMFNTDRMSGEALVEFARRVESTGIDTLWVPELFGREPFAASGHLLANTSTLTVATGIANVYARDAVAAAAGGATLAEFSGDRFVLGLGVSNAGLVGMRGHDWEPPVEKIQVPGFHAAPVHVAAHGPKMLEMAVQHADGISTYLQTPEHTAQVRSMLNDEQAINVTQMCLLCDDPVEARRLARRAINFYVGLAYYHRAWRKLGFDDSDFVDGGSDRLVDTLVAWGAPDQLRARVDEHVSAGATEVVVVPLNPAGGAEPHWPVLEALAG